MFQLGKNLCFAPANWDAVQWRGHVYDDNILFKKPDRSKKANFFKNNPVVHCIVSCAEKYFMATQLSSLNLDSFIFQLRQWALESQDTCKRWYVDHKPVSYRWDICQEPSFQSRKNQKTAKVKFTKRTDFHWFKSWLLACLNCSYELHLWYPAGTTVFFFYMMSCNYHD